MGDLGRLRALSSTDRRPVMADLSPHATAAQRGILLSDALRRRRLKSELGPVDRLKVIDTLVPLLEGVYCHLPQKRAGYAVDPVQALRLLRQRCVELTDGEFHLAITGIITGLRDAHTRYVGPSGLRGRVATLPFLVESFGPYAAARFIVSKLAQTADVEDPDFVEGVELVSWNFVPMSRAVDVYSTQETGGAPTPGEQERWKHSPSGRSTTGRPPTSTRSSSGSRPGERCTRCVSRGGWSAYRRQRWRRTRRLRSRQAGTPPQSRSARPRS